MHSTVSETDVAVQCNDAEENSKLCKKCPRQSRLLKQVATSIWIMHPFSSVFHSNHQCRQSWGCESGCYPGSRICQARSQSCVSSRMSTKDCASGEKLHCMGY